MLKKIAILGLGLGVFLGGCGMKTDDEKIKIGVLLPLFGPFASYGKIVREGIEQVSLPENVELIWEDTSCDNKTALTAWRKLKDTDNIYLFLGPTCGSVQKLIAPLSEDSESFFMLFASPSDDLYQSSGGNMFATQYAIESESKFNAQEMNRLEVKKVVILGFESDFDHAHIKAFKENFEGEIVDTLLFSGQNTESMKSLILKLQDKDFETLYVPDVYPFMLGLKKEMMKLGMQDKQVWSIFSFQSQDVLDMEGIYANGVIYSYPKIGDQDAVSYFPKLATELMYEASLACEGESECVKGYLQNNFDFNENGVLKGEIELRTVKDGKFVKFEE